MILEIIIFVFFTYIPGLNIGVGFRPINGLFVFSASAFFGTLMIIMEELRKYLLRIFSHKLRKNRWS